MDVKLGTLPFIFVGGLRFVAISAEQRPVVKCKLWSEKSTQKTYEAVTIRGASVRRPATQYDVPKSTLHDRVAGKVALGARSGPKRYVHMDRCHGSSVQKQTGDVKQTKTALKDDVVVIEFCKTRSGEKCSWMVF